MVGLLASTSSAHATALARRARAKAALVDVGLEGSNHEMA